MVNEPQALEVVEETELAANSTAMQAHDEISPIAVMLSQGEHSVEKIERLWAMQKEFEERQAKTAYFQAMAKVRAELPVIIKDRKNTHLGNTYATLDAMIAGVGPIAGQYGVSISFDYDQESVPGNVITYCIASHELGFSESKKAVMPLLQSIVSKQGKQATNACQAVASTMTYGQRRAFGAMFSIATGDDEDGNTLPPPPAAQSEIKLLNLDQYTALLDSVEDAGSDVEQFKDKILAPRYSGTTGVEPATYPAIPADHLPRLKNIIATAAKNNAAMGAAK